MFSDSFVMINLEKNSRQLFSHCNFESKLKPHFAFLFSKSVHAVLYRAVFCYKKYQAVLNRVVFLESVLYSHCLYGMQHVVYLRKLY